MREQTVMLCQGPSAGRSGRAARRRQCFNWVLQPEHALVEWGGEGWVSLAEGTEADCVASLRKHR